MDVEKQLNQFRLQGLSAETMAKEAEQRKNDLIIYLAHDLKTPLTSVIGYLSLLQDEPLISPELRARYTGIALDKALRLEDLIGEFFDITRFNLTTLTLEQEQVNLSRMLEQITYEFLPVLSEKGLSWQLDIQPEVQINCDPDKLQRVFDNLIRNAVNYSYPDSSISLAMKTLEPCQTGTSAGQTSRIEVKVSNHGKTIPRRSWSGSSSNSSAWTPPAPQPPAAPDWDWLSPREIVELHGGRIRAESANERIRFTLWLPQS